MLLSNVSVHITYIRYKVYQTCRKNVAKIQVYACLFERKNRLFRTKCAYLRLRTSL